MRSAVEVSAHQMKRLLGAVCHKDDRAVKDSAIVLRADRVETLEAEPTALGPEKVLKRTKLSVCLQREKKPHTDFFGISFLYRPPLQHAVVITS